MTENIPLIESAQKSAEHYNIMIWTVFSVGIAFSLWILLTVWPSKMDIRSMHFAMSTLGLLVLFYCILAIESFSQKKDLMYRICNKKIKEISKVDFKKEIDKLPFFRMDWIAEIILLGALLLYLFLFLFIAFKESLTTELPELFGIVFAWLLGIVSVIFFVIVILNWLQRPKKDSGNFLERIRKRF